MREVILYIAMSLDGYIADAQGGVDWLGGHGEPEEGMESYSRLLQRIDTVVMGWNTYHQVTTQLSPDRWVYEGLHTFVITHRPLPAAPGITFTAEDPCALVRRLRREEGKAVWICGGGSVVQPLVREDLIDEYHLSIIPTLLGSGIRLFGELADQRKLRLVQTQSTGGIAELIYRRR